MPKASKSKGQSKMSKAKAAAGMNQKIVEDKTFGAPPSRPSLADCRAHRAATRTQPGCASCLLPRVLAPRRLCASCLSAARSLTCTLTYGPPTRAQA